MCTCVRKFFRLAATLAFLVLAAGDAQRIGLAQEPCTIAINPGISIQTVINGAPAGTVICLASGTWNENIRIAKDVILRGVDRSTTIIKAKETNWSNAFSTPAIEVNSTVEIQVTIENLTVTESTYGIIVLGEANLMIQNVSVTDNGTAMSIGDSTRVSLAHSRILNNNDGIETWENAQLTITDSYISGEGIRRQSTGILVAGTATAEINKTYIADNHHCGVYVTSQNARIHGSNNDMPGNAAPLCGFAPASLRNPLVPQTDKTQLAVPQDYDSLQEAVDAIAPGGTISVAPGSLETGFTIWKSLILQGSGATQTDLRSLGTWYDIVISVIAEVQGVTISRLKVSGGSLLIYSSNTRIQETQYFNAGVQAAGSATANVTDSFFFDGGLRLSGFASLALSNTTFSSHGISVNLQGSANIAVDNSSLTCGDRRGVGIRIDGAVTVVLTNTSVTDCATGLYLDDQRGASVSLMNSTISDNDRGVQFPGGRGGGTIIIDNSVISNNRYDGISLTWASNASITNSTIAGNGRSGLEIWGVPFVLIKGSKFETNGVNTDCKDRDPRPDLLGICNGIEVRGESHITIVDSTIKNNADWGVTAWLWKCGFGHEDFKGSIEFQSGNIIEGNNTSGNQNGVGNPGNHLWNRTDVPDGQVCLP